MTLLEWIAAAAGVLCVWLAVRRSLLNYPFAILSVLLLFVVMWDARLYSGALLQLFFVAINLFGWWNWRRSAAQEGAVRVGRLSGAEAAGAAAGVLVLSIGWGAMMATGTDAAFPYVDAAVAMLSVGAQTLQALRRLECWIVWIAVDLIAAPLYAVQGLTVVAALYLVYLGLAVWGLIDWRRAWMTERTTA